MNIAPHPALIVQKLQIGRERAPLLVIDNLVDNAEELIELAASKVFSDVVSHYPGIRAKVPLSYQQFVLQNLRGQFAEYFGLHTSLRFKACHFSLVTMPPEKLAPLQRIPHIDSAAGNEIAFIHYVFKAAHGGTSFYRHRKTGYEVISPARKAEYFASVEAESHGPNKPPLEYINGDTPLYEEVVRHEGLFNRMLVYRGNSLHSACLGRDFVADPNPRTGRLSINGFLL